MGFVKKKAAKVPPATVLQRLNEVYKKHKNLPPLTIDIKQEIGNKVKEAFFTPDKKNYGATKKRVVEREGTFQVLCYPGYFVSRIDAIILSYFKIPKSYQSGKTRNIESRV